MIIYYLSQPKKETKSKMIPTVRQVFVCARFFLVTDKRPFNSVFPSCPVAGQKKSPHLVVSVCARAQNRRDPSAFLLLKKNQKLVNQRVPASCLDSIHRNVGFTDIKEGEKRTAYQISSFSTRLGSIKKDMYQLPMMKIYTKSVS